MNNITSDEQQIHDDTPLTRTQVETLFRELEEQRNREREIQTNGVELPLAISETLENSSTTQLKDEFRSCKKTIQRYNHPDWTSVQQINKEYIPGLKNWKVDAYQLVSSIYKNTETTRIQARASTEIYEQLQYLQEKAVFTSARDQEVFNNTVEQAQRLAIFGFGSAKFQENDAKDLSLKALRLPPNARHLEHSIEEDGKTNAFDREFVEQLQKARHTSVPSRITTARTFAFH